VDYSTDKSVTVPELAAMLQISGQEVFQLAAAGVLPHFRASGALQFDPELIHEWLKRNDLASLLGMVHRAAHLDNL
jgi:hypothetical protein